MRNTVFKISEDFLRVWFQPHSSHVLRDYVHERLDDDDSLEHYLVAALLLEANFNGRLLNHSDGDPKGRIRG